MTVISISVISRIGLTQKFISVNAVSIGAVSITESGVISKYDGFSKMGIMV